MAFIEKWLCSCALAVPPDEERYPPRDDVCKKRKTQTWRINLVDAAIFTQGLLNPRAVVAPGP